MISRRAGILFAAYRLADFADPDSFAASVSMVLEDYPDEVILFCTDPKTGMQRRYPRPPAISEIVKELDEEVSRRQRMDRYKNWGKSEAAQIAGPVVEKPTYEQLQAKYGKDWGLDPTGGAASRKPEPAPSWDQVVAMYQAQPGRILELANLLPKMRGEL